MQEQTAGFTLVEVAIFLAVSGMLLLMVIVGTGTLAARQRFSDTTDSLQAYVQAQYEEVVNGVNVRTSGGNNCASDDSSPGTSDCLLIGKLLTLSTDGTKIQSAYVISTAEPAASASTDQAKLIGASLKVSTEGQSTYELKWSAQVLLPSTTRSTPPTSGGSDRGEVNSIAFLRLPDSGRIVQVFYKSVSGANYTLGLTAALGADAAALDPPSTRGAVASDADKPSLAICLKNDNDFGILQVRSAVELWQGRGAGNITTNYEPGVLCQ